MSANLCSCSHTGTSDPVISGLNPSLCSQRAPRVLEMWWSRWSKAFWSLHLCALQILQALQPPTNKGLSLTYMLHQWNKKQDLNIWDWPNEWQSGQPMAQQYWGPQGVSYRGCNTSRAEADALLTPCQTQGEMLMTFSLKHWGDIERETLMTLYLSGH